MPRVPIRPVILAAAALTPLAVAVPTQSWLGGGSGGVALGSLEGAPGDGWAGERGDPSRAAPVAQGIGSPVGPGGRGGEPPSAEKLVQLDVVQVDAHEPGGIELAVVMTLEPGWHVYWQNPGDSGMAPAVKVTVPTGWKVGPVRWPAPRRFKTPDETTYGYERAVALFVPVQPPPGQTGEASLTVEASWMVCKSICLTGSATREIKVAPGQAPAVANAATRRIVDESRARLPQIAASGQAKLDLAADRRSGTLRVALGKQAPPAGHDVRFIPADTPGVTYGPGRVEQGTTGNELLVPLDVDPGNALGQALRAAGVVVWMAADGATATEPTAIAVDVPMSTAPQRGAAGTPGEGSPARPAGPPGEAR